MAVRAWCQGCLSSAASAACLWCQRDAWFRIARFWSAQMIRCGPMAARACHSCARFSLASAQDLVHSLDTCVQPSRTKLPRTFALQQYVCSSYRVWQDFAAACCARVRALPCLVLSFESSPVKEFLQTSGPMNSLSIVTTRSTCYLKCADESSGVRVRVFSAAARCLF